MTEELVAVAWKLHVLGYSAIPSGAGDDGKQPLVSWTEFQQRQPTDEELQDWQYKLRPELWGIVTGQVSGVVVIDADTGEAREILECNHLVPHILTPRGGGHYYFEYPGHTVKTCAGLLPGIDVRADGGFVNMVGKRKDGGEYKVQVLPSPDNLYPWADLPAPIADALNNGREATRVSEGEAQPIPEGKRNSRLTSIGGSLRAKGLPQPAMEEVLQVINRDTCSPPLPEAEVSGIAKSVSRYPSNPTYGHSNNHMYSYNTNVTDDLTPNRHKTVTPFVTSDGQETHLESLSSRIQEWIEQTTGWFETPELDRDLDITSARDKDNRRQALCRLREKGIIEPHPKRNKAFRFVNTNTTSLAFKTASNAGILPLKWPLGIERFVNLFPGNVAVVAGSPNAGKTALLLNFIYLNQHTFPIYYLCSEMGAVELRARLELFADVGIEDWKFEAIERSSDFADVIRPDCVNLVDYLEMTTDLYAVNTHLTSISHKLGTGIAVVALQKKEGAIFGRGQEFSVEKPKLYLSMDRGKLTIVKGKSWATRHVDPHRLAVKFKIIDGCRFEATSKWDWPSGERE